MRITFVDQYSELGGAQLCLTEVMAAVAKRGWDAELWAPGNGPLHTCARQNGFEAKALPIGHYANARKSAMDMVHYALNAARSRHYFTKAIRNKPVDLIYVNGPRVLPCVGGMREPVIFHSHSVIDKPYSRWIARWSLYASRATILASSEYLGSRLRASFDPKRVRVIYNGVPDCGFRPIPENGPIRIGIVGRIAPEKGHLEFLEAARILAGRGAMRFTVVGAGRFSTSGYEEQVRQIGASLGVAFSGWRDPAELYCDLDILVVPSAMKDANPRVLMEAMSAGVCTIAYRSGGIPEIVTHGFDGLITDRNPGALANAIMKVINDAGLRQHLCVNARKTYEARFMVRRFQDEVCEVMAAAASGQALCSRDGSSARAGTALSDDGWIARL